ncbi:MAG: hypothetical protein JO100_11280 [Pseudonocardia sp.]|nr:hypothetical protein [Pseudonocardia sp.]
MIASWFTRAMAVLSGVIALMALASVGVAQAAGSPRVCYRAHVENIGWQGWTCDGSVAGTVGQSLRLEALEIRTDNSGGLCAQAHVESVGWETEQCKGDGQVIGVGTAGQALRMEALHLRSITARSVCASGHVQNVGWQGGQCARDLGVGTAGQALSLEAVKIQWQ